MRSSKMVHHESPIWLNLANEAKWKAVSRSWPVVFDSMWCHRLPHPCSKGSTRFQSIVHRHFVLTDTKQHFTEAVQQRSMWSDLKVLGGFGLSQGETELFHACLLLTAHSFLNSILWSWFLNLKVGKLMVFNFLKLKSFLYLVGF